MIFITDFSELPKRTGTNLLYYYATWIPDHRQILAMLSDIEIQCPKLNIYCVDIETFDRLRRKLTNLPAFLIIKKGDRDRLETNNLSLAEIEAEIRGIYIRTRRNTMTDTKDNTPKTHPDAPSVQVRPVDETFTEPVVMNAAAATTAAVPVAVSSAPTQAEQLWTEIQNKRLEMWALPAQTVSKYCTPITVEPSKLYLDYRGVGAVVPALEAAIGPRYIVELMDRFAVVSLNQPGLRK